MEHSVQRFLFPYTKIRPVHCKVSGALKTDSFLTAARSLQAGLMQQAEQGICKQTLCS